MATKQIVQGADRDEIQVFFFFPGRSKGVAVLYPANHGMAVSGSTGGWECGRVAKESRTGFFIFFLNTPELNQL